MISTPQAKRGAACRVTFTVTYEQPCLNVGSTCRHNRFCTLGRCAWNIATFVRLTHPDRHLYCCMKALAALTNGKTSPGVWPRSAVAVWSLIAVRVMGNR